MKKKLFSIVLVVFVYLLSIYIVSPETFSYRFSQSLVSKYFHSQDITHDVPGRIFLSDSDIHIASGYLYLNGYDPTEINFQHPPLIKYLFGLSIKVFNNPYVAQLILGSALVVLVFEFSHRLTGKIIFALLSSFLLIIDPLMVNLSTNALLDLGQMVFILLYVYLSIFYPKKPILHGLIFGLACGAKFWAAPLFFLSVISLHQIVKREFDLKKLLITLVTAFITFCFVYLPSFLHQNFMFNIVYFELRTIRYWFDHSVTSYPLSSLFYFVTGYYKKWWGDMQFARSQQWAPIWPILLAFSTYYAILSLFRRKYSFYLLLMLSPILYLCYLGVQAPFDRYFIIVLPFLYIMTPYIVFKLTSGHKSL